MSIKPPVHHNCCKFTQEKKWLMNSWQPLSAEYWRIVCGRTSLQQGSHKRFSVWSYWSEGITQTKCKRRYSTFRIKLITTDQTNALTLWQCSSLHPLLNVENNEWKRGQGWSQFILRWGLNGRHYTEGVKCRKMREVGIPNPAFHQTQKQLQASACLYGWQVNTSM